MVRWFFSFFDPPSSFAGVCGCCDAGKGGVRTTVFAFYGFYSVVVIEEIVGYRFYVDGPGWAWNAKGEGCLEL